MNHKERHDTEAGISTFVIALLLLILFLFVNMNHGVDDDLAMNGGIEVIFGDPNAGGADNSAAKGDPGSTPATPSFQTPKEQSDVTMDNDDAVVVKKKDPVKNPNDRKKPSPPVKKQPTPEEIEAAKKQAKLDALNKFLNKSGSGGNDDKGSSSGPSGHNSGRTGDKNGGNTGADKGNGGRGGDPKGSGIGIGGKVGNRSITHFPDNTEKYNSKCFVKVKVTVDKQGNVTKAVGARGSRCNDTKLLNLAIKLAYKTKFQSTSSGPPKAEGEMSFNFGLK